MKSKRASALIPGLVILGSVALCGCSTFDETHNRGMNRYFKQEASLGAGAEVTAGMTEPAAPEAPKPDPDRSDRIMIYNAEVSLVVGSISEAQRAIERNLKPLGAYMQRMDGRAIVMKVPVARFAEAVAVVEKLGEVTNKSISGEDVTEQMRDLNIRLKNALEVRDRLAKLLEQAAKMEDAIQVEKELERVTETVELLKSKIRFLETSAAFSTLTVKLNSPLPQRPMEMEIPFPWVRGLGMEVGGGSAGNPYLPWLGSGVGFDLPEGFLKYFESDHVTRAMSGENVLIVAARHENFPGGTKEFWTPCARRALVAGRAFALKGDPQEIKLKSGCDAVCLTGTKDVGARRYGYILALVTLKSCVYTFEAWGEEEQFEAQKAKLMEAIESLRP